MLLVSQSAPLMGELAWRKGGLVGVVVVEEGSVAVTESC